MADRSVFGSIGLFVLVKCCRTHDLRLFLIRTFPSWRLCVRSLLLASLRAILSPHVPACYDPERSQFSTESDLIRENSRTLSVTIV
jgi:hypothetical protein